MSFYQRSDGNALFLILIALALFGALSYAVTQSSRGGGDISREQALLDDAQAEQCTALVEYGINKIKLLNGCVLDQFSYELPDGSNANSDAPSDERCHIFRDNGGGVTPCGPHLEVEEVETGLIVAGDTTTIAVTGGGGYFRCITWDMDYNMCTAPQFSINGTSFIDPADVALGDSSLSTRLNAVCAGACSGTYLGAGTPNNGLSKPYLLGLTGDITEVADPSTNTSRTMSSLRCTCWSGL